MNSIEKLEKSADFHSSSQFGSGILQNLQNGITLQHYWRTCFSKYEMGSCCARTSISSHFILLEVIDRLCLYTS